MYTRCLSGKTKIISYNQKTGKKVVFEHPEKLIKDKSKSPMRNTMTHINLKRLRAGDGKVDPYEAAPGTLPQRGDSLISVPSNISPEKETFREAQVNANDDFSDIFESFIESHARSKSAENLIEYKTAKPSLYDAAWGIPTSFKLPGHF